MGLARLFRACERTPPFHSPSPRQITAVVSGTVAYGAISLVKKYLLPHLKPPTATAYEQDRDALTAQFDAAEALLKEIQAETASVRAAVDEQRERVDKASRDVQAVVVEMRQGETKTRDEMREIRDEIENIREMLPKVVHILPAVPLSEHCHLQDDREKQGNPKTVSRRASARAQVPQGTFTQPRSKRSDEFPLDANTGFDG